MFRHTDHTFYGAILSAGADPEFPVGGCGPPMWVLFGENVCENEGIGSHKGGGVRRKILYVDPPMYPVYSNHLQIVLHSVYGMYDFYATKMIIYGLIRDPVDIDIYFEQVFSAARFGTIEGIHAEVIETYEFLTSRPIRFKIINAAHCRVHSRVCYQL